MQNEQSLTQSTGKNTGIKLSERDGVYFMALLVKNKWFIIAFTVIATTASVFYSLSLPNWYASTVNSVPPQTSGDALGGAIGGIASALKDFGIGGSKGVKGGGYSFIVILNSRSLADTMISKYKLRERYGLDEMPYKQVLAAFYANLDVSYEKEGNFTISVWDTNSTMAATMANDYVKLANELAIRVFREETELNVSHMEERLARIDSMFKITSDSLKKFSSKYMMYSPEEQAQAASVALSDVKAQLLNYEILYEYYLNNYGPDYSLTAMHRELLTEAKNKLKEIENQPGFVGNFSLRDASEVGIEYMRLYTDLETYSKVKAFILPSAEQVRLDAYKNIQNLFVIDDAVPADKKDRPKRSVYVLGAFVGSLTIGILIILLINGIKSFNNKYKQIKQNL